MNLKNLFTDDDAVSPVIGVILMVAITVILAAVIGAFVLNIGGSQEKVPQASWAAEYPDTYETGGADATDTIVLTHEGGDSIDVSTLSVSIGGNGADTVENLGAAGNYIASGDQFSSSTVSAGASVTITEYNASGASYPSSGTDDLAMEPGDKVQIIWSSPSSDSSQVIFTSQIP
ncbi:type IV pilin [Haloarchaeobius sp. DYHT-AS-18]|uniref:type IV pilin n=1 Tax=Haloarchaeobius sp. DYHT-AS-18 TaxID=3446117 RepID=UPI003EB6A78E